MIPKYSISGPFKGHLSMKSSPLFPGSSCSLSTQFLIQDHMSTHYRKLDSAKAAVDTSAPRSLSSSIKYRDQQNKERLLRAVDKFTKELQQIRSTSHHHSPSNFPAEDKVYYGSQKSLMDPDKPQTRSQTYDPVLVAREVVRRIEKELNAENLRTSINQSLPSKKPYNDPQKQTYSGDLLDRHPTSFTKSNNKPFNPRLVKKPSKSFLSDYRYYTAPRKRSSERATHHDKTWRHRPLESPIENINQTPRSIVDKRQVTSGATREEDRKYLNFLENLTNDIIQRGCRSNSAMERVFHDHLHRKHPNINEQKKKILVEELRDELERSVKLDFSISYDGTQYRSGSLRRLLKT
ncbi:spermatogenesis-associated protein 7 homolog isoform X2 [Engystomops pustulosus]